jgi:hypothetical protein
MVCRTLVSQEMTCCLLPKGSRQTRSSQWSNKRRMAWFGFEAGQLRGSQTTGSIGYTERAACHFRSAIFTRIVCSSSRKTRWPRAAMTCFARCLAARADRQYM